MLLVHKPLRAGVSFDEYRRLRGALMRPTFDCGRHPVPGTSAHPRLGGKPGPRRDLLRSALAAGASRAEASARTVSYFVLHLVTSENRLCYPPRNYADLVACSDVLENLPAVLCPASARDRPTRERIGRE